MSNQILKKCYYTALMIRYIRILSILGFIVIIILLLKEIYDWKKTQIFFLEKTENQILTLLSQYESAVNLSESVAKSHNVQFVNKLMSFKDDFPKVISIANITTPIEIEKVKKNKNTITLLVGAGNNLFYVEILYEELVLYLLLKIQAESWFAIKVESIIDGYQVKYNGSSFLVYLAEIISDHNTILVLFCSIIILFGISQILKSFFLEVTRMIELQNIRLKDFEENEKQLIKNIDNLQAYQDMSNKKIYLLFNRAISNNVNSLDKEEIINLSSLIKEAISLLAPLYSNKNVIISINETLNSFVETSSREILLIIILNYIYRSIIRSAKNEKVTITLINKEKKGVILKIIDKGYFYVEKTAGEISDIFCLPQELLILLSKKLGIEVITSKTQYNITNIIINTNKVNEFGKNNVITLKK